MRFFDRTKEIEALRNIRVLSEQNAQFTVVTGRRRIGKTNLVWKAYEDRPFLYFFVTKKAETDLCESYIYEIEQKLGIPMLGRADRFADIFEYVLKLSEKRPITLFIDEFQRFSNVNKSIYGDMQRIWDMYEKSAHINLIVCGSIYSMMIRLFRDKDQPLYGRQTRFLHVKAFTPSVLKEIISEYNPNYTNDDLLALYTFTGGVAKYVQLLMDAGAFTKELMIEEMVRPDSIFIDEGKAMLIEEFGSDYGVYFSIMSAISRGVTTRSKIEQLLNKEIGGYLTNLEREYELISKKQPMFSRTERTNILYCIDDNFLMFWFRFIYKYNYILEIAGYDKVRQIIERDYNTFSGIMLERYFKEVLVERNEYTRLDRWWDRKGENEIDLIAENELDDTAVFFEIKRKKENIKLDILKEKSQMFLKSTGQFRNYQISYDALSIDDM